MKKLLLSIALMCVFAFSADKMVFEVCNPNFCYEQVLENVKSWEWKTDNAGKKFVRVYFYDKRILDIKGDGMTIKPLKKK